MRRGALALVMVACGVAALATAEDPETVAGRSPEEALKLGERMYREGILPSGKPMRALVSEDVEVDGTMFSCSSCHLRSGRGSLEGTVITLPTCASWLYKPLVGREMKQIHEERLPKWLNPPPSREAYTDRLVARAIWTGKDPNGRELNWVMPRYKLSTRDMEILVYYLKNLSAKFSPGVDDTTIHFATVVSHDVAQVDRDAMLEVLEAHVRDRNSQVRHDERRARNGPFNMEEVYSPYRRYSLSVWELEGDRASWPDQLERYYREDPVFALLGGMVTGDWSPIHSFCERNRIPCLFPITDFPVISESDWYTLYFDRGYSQEGEAAARFLRRDETALRDAPVVQVLRDTREGHDLARGFAEARAAMGLPAAVERVLGADERADARFWTQLAAQHPDAVLALWLEPGDLHETAALATAAQRPPLAFVSQRLLGEELTALPEDVRPFTFITYPGSLPEDGGRTRLGITNWLRVKHIEVTNFDVQARMYFAGWMLAGAVKMMRDDFYRDYFLDLIGMMRDESYSIATVYPRVSFGPGQRYASKGCYIVQLTGGREPGLERRSGWVIH